jgi:hypothetical protein
VIVVQPPAQPEGGSGGLPVPAGANPGEAPIDLVQNGFEPSEPGPGDCGIAGAKATVVTPPVDIIIVVDNSGSMSEEIVGIQDNINLNFANILAAAAIDYRVILVAQYGSSASNLICIEAPLGGASSCDPLPPAAVFADRFFQFEGKVRSHNSLRLLLEGYRLDPNDDGEDARANRDQAGMATTGWHEYIRPGSRKVFLEFTDDDADVGWDEFDRTLLQLDPGEFGTESNRNYIWHSIVGMAEKPPSTEAYLPGEPIQEATCGEVEAPGLQYQELSRLTGGLRFPLCRPDAYDVVFQTIASDVIRRTEVACDFPMPPPPPGRMLDLDKVAVEYTPFAGALQQTYGQAPDLASCQPDAFYIEDNQISLCPETCALLQENPTALVNVLFTCETTLVNVR